jgi:hypothetical protein
MSDADIASIAVRIDQKTITDTVERIVLQEIASKLGDPGAYFDRVIKSCVMQTVDSNGNPSKSAYDRTTLIEYTANKAVSEFAKTVINKWMEANTVALETAVIKALQKNIAPMAKVLADAATRSVSWGQVSVTLATKEPR